ncbi:hypothetical protein J6590_040442 [Homalodisca vitripennis]|nr:hypothetical protein J6590_040442 [Homalodisca vitripennis]
MALAYFWQDMEEEEEFNPKDSSSDESSVDDIIENIKLYFPGSIVNVECSERKKSILSTQTQSPNCEEEGQYDVDIADEFVNINNLENVSESNTDKSLRVVNSSPYSIRVNPNLEDGNFEDPDCNLLFENNEPQEDIDANVDCLYLIPLTLKAIEQNNAEISEKEKPSLSTQIQSPNREEEGQNDIDIAEKFVNINNLERLSESNIDESLTVLNLSPVNNNTSTVNINSIPVNPNSEDDNIEDSVSIIHPAFENNEPQEEDTVDDPDWTPLTAEDVEPDEEGNNNEDNCRKRKETKEKKNTF